MTVTFEDIQRAQTLLRGHVVRTPLLYAHKLSALLKTEIWLKAENLQVTNSFKDRGAYVKISQLSSEEKKRGVIAMSAGNHAQAVAYHAKKLGIPATIVMPETTPFTKIERTRAHGASVVLYGEQLADSQVKAEALITEKGYTLIHPYDDDAVISGQGTIGLEMYEDAPEIDCVVVPIGGGGVIAGTALALKTLKPSLEVLGVEVESYASMFCALQGKKASCKGATLAEGIAVKNVTERTVALCRRFVDDILLVGESQIEQSIMAYLAEEKLVVEGAGAAGLAAILSNPTRFSGKRVGLVVCGGNIDPRILSSVIYRELERGYKVVTLRILIDDRPGVLGMIATLMGEKSANILEVSHRRLFLGVPAKGAELEITLETRDHAHVLELIRAVEAKGFKVNLLECPGGREVSG